MIIFGEKNKLFLSAEILNAMETAVYEKREWGDRTRTKRNLPPQRTHGTQKKTGASRRNTITNCINIGKGLGPSAARWLFLSDDGDHPIAITSGCRVALSSFINGVLSAARETFVQFLQLNGLSVELQKFLATGFSCPYTS